MADVQDLIGRGATFIVNHSGGKDSQAMLSYLRRVVPLAQLQIIHAELPGVDWPGIPEHIEATAGGLPVHYCRASKTFFEMVEHRGMFPSPKYRQCTSDLKRGPIEVVIKRLSRETGQKLFVNCVGLRAAESPQRRKQTTWRLDSDELNAAGRTVYRWLPIHAWSTAQVFAEIENAGQQPHPAYTAGMSRLSCCFCIMSSKGDLRTAARLKPELFARYCETERRLGQSMMMPAENGARRFLDDIVNETNKQGGLL